MSLARFVLIRVCFQFLLKLMLVAVAGFAASRLGILPVVKGLQVQNLIGGRVEFLDTRIVVTRI